MEGYSKLATGILKVRLVCSVGLRRINDCVLLKGSGGTTDSDLSKYDAPLLRPPEAAEYERWSTRRLAPTPATETPRLRLDPSSARNFLTLR